MPVILVHFVVISVSFFVISVILGAFGNSWHPAQSQFLEDKSKLIEQGKAESTILVCKVHVYTSSLLQKTVKKPLFGNHVQSNSPNNSLIQGVVNLQNGLNVRRNPLFHNVPNNTMGLMYWRLGFLIKWTFRLEGQWKIYGLLYLRSTGL